MGKLIDLPRFGRWLGRVFGEAKNNPDELREKIQTGLSIINLIGQNVPATKDDLEKLAEILMWANGIVGDAPALLKEIEEARAAAADFVVEIDAARQMIAAGEFDTDKLMAIIDRIKLDYEEMTDVIDAAKQLN